MQPNIYEKYQNVFSRLSFSEQSGFLKITSKTVAALQKESEVDTENKRETKTAVIFEAL